MLNNLVGQPAELRATIQIKRAATGKTEEFLLVGHTTVEVAEQITNHKEQVNDNNTLDRGA